VYLDDCLIVNTASFGHHLEKLEVVLQYPQMCNLKVNAEKSASTVDDLEYLGYVITNPKKIQGILNLERPKMKCDVCHLIGLMQ
jgi:Reverse transcriptase (RNA-dependent DNA polymerase).